MKIIRIFRHSKTERKPLDMTQKNLSGFDVFYKGAVLTLNLPNATPPVMTRLDLSKTPSFQFNLSDGKSLQFRSAPEATPATIASFANDEEAARILSEISAVLQGRSTRSPQKKTLWTYIKRAFHWLLIICGLLFILLAMYSCIQMKIMSNVDSVLQTELSKSYENHPNTETETQKQPPAGEPVPADDFLADPVTSDTTEGAQ